MALGPRWSPGGAGTRGGGGTGGRPHSVAQLLVQIPSVLVGLFPWRQELWNQASLLMPGQATPPLCGYYCCVVMLEGRPSSH